MIDEGWNGAGWTRNRGIEKSAQSDFIVFLDVDDTIEPNFVERCLDVWQEGAYVYTDWMRGNDVIQAPENPWRADGSWHVITALIPTPAVIETDGFDETVSGGEDSIFYWSLTRNGCCGIHLEEALFHYGHEGQRAKEFVNNQQAYQYWKQTLLARFKNQMGCCGDETPNPPDVPGNEPFEGSILVRAIWDGNRIERGIVTGRLYERAGNGKQIYVDARDVAAAPHLWRPIIETVSEPKRLNVATNGVKPVPSLNGVHEIARALFPNAPPPDIEALAAIEPVGRGDVGQILRLAKNG